MQPRTPAGRLVVAFGDVEKMQSLYAPQIAWFLPASLPYPRPIAGKDAVVSFNRAVWSVSYFADCSMRILDEVGDQGLSAVRFIYRARFRETGGPYENEYTLFARSGAHGITEVFEAMDSLAVLDQLGGEVPGAAFARFRQARANSSL